MAIKPFRDIAGESVANNIATRKWTLRLIQKLLGKLHFTGSVKQSADGHVHIDGGGDGDGAECSFPLRVHVADIVNGFAKVMVQPGYVRSELTQARWPVISGSPINGVNPPWLSVPITSNADRYIIIDINYDPGRASNSEDFNYFNGAVIDQAPTIYLSSSPPQDQAPTIDWTTLEVTSSGAKRVALATIKPDGAIVQAWSGNMNVLLLGTGAVWVNSAA